MSVIGIVALSLLAGLFLALLIGTSAWLLWQADQFKKTVTATRDTLASHREHWDGALKSLSVMLESHRVEISQSIARINGDELSRAVKMFVGLIQEQRSAASRTEQAAGAIGRFAREFLSERALDDNLTPITEGIDQETGYARTSPGDKFVSRSHVAASDAEALADESADVTQAE